MATDVVLSNRTPIRVRGKRYVTGQDKPRAKRQRLADRLPLSKTDALDTRIRSPQPKPISKAKQLPLSRLEQLPTEMIELIFLFSGNVNLPFVSRTLYLKLSSTHLQTSIIDITLATLLRKDVIPSDAEVSNIQQLIDRKFFTWSAFQQWLDHNVVTPQALEELLNGPYSPRALSEERPECYYAWISEAHFSSVIRRLRLPDRVFMPPWSGERMILFTFWFELFKAASHGLDSKADQARDALPMAIEQSAHQAITSLLVFDGVLDESWFEYAVVKGGCDLQTIQIMLAAFTDARRNHRDVQFNALNPFLWQWADEPEQIESGKGKLLKEALTDWLARQR